MSFFYRRNIQNGEKKGNISQIIDSGEFMNNLNFEDLYIEIVEDKETIKIIWNGESLNQHPAKGIDPYFNTLINQLPKTKLIEIDFTRLKIMNSSTVLPILRLIKNLEDLNIKANVLYDASQSWQRACFKPLGAITINYRNIKVIPADK